MTQMIEIKDKSQCCGCNACVQRCPKQCIAMCEDEEGFLYPEVDEAICIDCGLCENVCPVINQADARILCKFMPPRIPMRNTHAQLFRWRIFYLGRTNN